MFFGTELQVIFGINWVAATLVNTEVMVTLPVIAFFAFMLCPQDGSLSPSPAPSEVPSTDPLAAGLPYPVFPSRTKGLTQPRMLRHVKPTYSEAAREKKLQGTVVLKIIIDANGDVARTVVVVPLGLGLDDKAMEAVKRWKFKPAFKDDHAVASTANIQVNFHLRVD